MTKLFFIHNNFSVLNRLMESPKFIWICPLLNNLCQWFERLFWYTIILRGFVRDKFIQQCQSGRISVLFWLIYEWLLIQHTEIKYQNFFLYVFLLAYFFFKKKNAVDGFFYFFKYLFKINPCLVVDCHNQIEFIILSFIDNQQCLFDTVLETVSEHQKLKLFLNGLSSHYLFFL